MTSNMPRLTTLEEARARAMADPSTPTLEELRANHDESVKESNEKYGASVPSFFLHLIPHPTKGAVRPANPANVSLPLKVHNEMLREPDMTFEDSLRSGMVASYLDYGTRVSNRIAQASRE